jgi:hypothetical protein
VIVGKHFDTDGEHASLVCPCRDHVESDGSGVCHYLRCPFMVSQSVSHDEQPDVGLGFHFDSFLLRSFGDSVAADSLRIGGL